MGNMGKEYIDMLLKVSEGFGIDLSLWQFCGLLLNSILLGVILTTLTYLSNAPLPPKNGDERKKKDIKKQIKVLIGSTNILFLCVGLTGVMVLVNNNLARALAIGATLGLVRFKIALGSKMIGSNMLFGIIAGIACGLNELFVAWAVTGVYALIQIAILVVIRKYKIDLSEKDAKKSDDDQDEDFDFVENHNEDTVEAPLQ